MTFLSNTEILAHQSGPQPLVRGVSLDFLTAGAEGPLEACAVKLRIGEIYLAPQSSFSAISSEDYVILKQGEMAFVLTLEEIHLPSDIGGLMFPKSGGVADRGILITNAGHIDPGYSGKLRYAIINMGNGQFTLRKGDFLVKVLFFSLSQPSVPSWSDLHSSIPAPSRTALYSLGRDFAAVEDRITKVAQQSVNEQFLKLGLFTIASSTVLSIILASVTVFFGLIPYFSSLIKP
jgi:dCTP deaminase